MFQDSMQRSVNLFQNDTARTDPTFFRLTKISKCH